MQDLLTSHNSFTYFIFSLTALNLHPNALHLLIIHALIFHLILLTFIYLLLPFSSLSHTAPCLPTFSHIFYVLYIASFISHLFIHSLYSIASIPDLLLHFLIIIHLPCILIFIFQLIIHTFYSIALISYSRISSHSHT